MVGRAQAVLGGIVAGVRVGGIDADAGCIGCQALRVGLGAGTGAGRDLQFRSRSLRPGVGPDWAGGSVMVDTRQCDETHRVSMRGEFHCIKV